MKKARKLLIAPLAALMLAGALSAISGATSIPSDSAVAVLGEGATPVPAVLPSACGNSAMPLDNHF